MRWVLSGYSSSVIIEYPLHATSKILRRAFTQTLNLINAAEVHHRMRILRKVDVISNRQSPLPMREDSIAGTIDKLLESETADTVLVSL
jgi:hypothetical protein